MFLFETVKRDKEVSVGYMKIFEMEQLLLDQGREEGLAEGRKQGLEEGRQEERVNTERERRRAQAAEEELARLKKELEQIRGK